MSIERFGKPDRTPAPVRTGKDLFGFIEDSVVARSQTLRPALGADVEHTFLLDCSGSMAGRKLEEMKAGALDAVIGLLNRGEAIRLISFGDEARVVLESVASRADAERALHSLGIEGGTAMELAVALARKRHNRQARAVFHVITDGEPNDQEATFIEARSAKEEGVVIRCIGVSGADETFLALLAGGEHAPRPRTVAVSELRSAIAQSAMRALPSAKP